MCASGLASCLLFLVGVSAAEGSIVYREPFSNELLEVHIILIVVPLCLTSLAICAAAVVACARTLRMTVLLVLGVWLALVCVGVVSWSVTYVASRDAILEHAEHSLSLTAAQAISAVMGEFGIGSDMMQSLQMLASTGFIDIEAQWPTPHIFFDSLLRNVGRHTTSISMLMVGTESGRFAGVFPRFRTDEGVVTDRHYICALPGDYLPEWARCEAADWGANCSQIATSSACANSSSEAAVHCAKSCGFPQNATRNCVGRLSLVPTNLANGSNTSRAVRHSIFEEPAADRQQPVTLEYDPRIRPWYTRNEAPMWSPPYVFATGELGITVSAGVITSYSGDFLGSVAVDYRLDTLNRFMSDVKPSDNGVAFLMTSDGLLVGSSMTDVELAQDTGVMKYKEVNDINIMNYSKTESESKIVRAVGAVRSKWGTVEAAAVGSSMYQYSDDVVVSYPIKLQGLTMLLVVSVPMSDIMGKADHASTLSLVMTVSISVGLALLAAVGLKVALLPLEKLRQNMYDVACMNVEGHEDGVSSHLTEIRSMQESFSTMVKNLIEYKQYLPQSILHDSGSEIISEGVTASRRSKGSHTSSSYVTQTASSASAESLWLRSRSLGDGAGMKLRNVSVMLTNVAGFVELSKTRPPAEVLAMHAHYLETVVKCVNGNRGIVDEFIGDKVHASFNTILASGLHRSAATECMSILQSTTCSGPSGPLQINTAAVSMKALCGNFGFKGMKKYTIVSSGDANVWTFERWGKAWGVSALVDSVIAQDTQGTFNHRRVAKVRLTSKRDAFVFELVSPKEVVCEEWMYQLEQGNAQSDEISTYNTAIGNLYEGKVDEALNMIRANMAGPDSMKLCTWAETCKSSCMTPTPIPISHIPDRTRIYTVSDYAYVPADNSAGR
eukprot:TRINITY_DN1004_c0_g1_i13.p1 TRINITY_DN1004_c0_g1~~TRINITY_DN1004_c0_g1_i13.p1  ORF type:complete len:895 (+),score=223.05 TRINITY_DN1004_c0_g1_i13:1659-4343(+)